MLPRLGRLVRRPTFVATVFYVAIVTVWFHRMVFHVRSECGCGLPGDPTMFVWAFAWYPHALLHGLPLFESHAVWTPTGQNLAATTTVPFIAFVMAPATWLWGPVVSYAIAMFLIPILNSLAAYALCRYISKAPWASIIAGATYGYGAYATAHLGGHMQLAFAIVPPLLVLCTLKLIEGTMRPRRFVILVAILLVAQIMTGTEVFFTMTVIGAVALVVGYWFSLPERRKQMLRSGRWLVLAYAIAMALTSYYLYLELSAPPVAVDLGLHYTTDLLGFVIPMPYTWFGGASLEDTTAKLTISVGETNAYLGVVLIAIVAWYITTSWKSQRTRFFTVMIAVTVLWILGTNLHIDGHRTIPLPYWFFAKAPVFKQVLQGRVALYLELICAVILALWLGRAGQWLRLRWVLGIVALLMVLPNLFHPYVGNLGSWENAKFFTTSMYKRYIPRHSRVMVLRWWADMNYAMVWQAQDHFYWNLADGSFTVIPHSWLDTPFDFDLFKNTPHAGDGPKLRAWLIEHHVENVVVEPDWLSLWQPTLAAAGLHTEIHVGGIYLYPVPKSWFTQHAGG